MENLPPHRTVMEQLGDAMEMMLLSILGPQLHCEWKLPSFMVAIITSVVFAGMGIGSPVWGNIADMYGRKISLILCMVWTMYFGLLTSFAPVYGWLLFLRGLVGFGIAGAPQSVTLYSEFLPVKARGICIMLIAMFWALGAVFEVLLALLIMPTLGWRWLVGLSTLPMAVFICLSFWLPESPRFDLLSGNKDKALATLARIAKDNGTAMPQGTIVDHRPNGRGHFKDLFIPQYRRTTLLLWFIWIPLTILIFIARAFISGGYQVAFVYTPEVYPTENRALGLGTCSAMARVGALITPFVAQVMLRVSVRLALSLYCGFCLLAGVAALLLPIETLGRFLQESNPDQEAEGEQTTATTCQLNSTTQRSE
ncbi:Synaptic vesicle 2-related protein [Nibea albiflora]|uniref:Synaptic vesicle 2-related protein n=1 Tax=Nibea albiflora TaxID=240163 RepID=A0ACB7F858_NIBAL|nr:Synaptic vesicle 2-related protein [Nibea albiflora]